MEFALIIPQAYSGGHLYKSAIAHDEKLVLAYQNDRHMCWLSTTHQFWMAEIAPRITLVCKPVDVVSGGKT